MAEKEVASSEQIIQQNKNTDYGSIRDGDQNQSDNNNHHKEEAQSPQQEFEEGGWGWVVVIASFLCNMTLDGIGYAFGVLLEPIRKDFNSNSGSISLVGSILTGVILLVGPISAALVNRFGARMTCILGSVISSAAIFGSSYTTSVPCLIISYGVFGGLGLGLIYVPSVVTVGDYFNKRLNLATGICVCGSGAGTFLFAPICGALVDGYGWRVTNRVMAAICLMCSVFGLAYRPKKNQSITNNNQPQEEKKAFNFKILFNKKFLLVMLANIPTVMSVYASYSYIPPMAQSEGLSVTHSSSLISAIGVTNTIGRILCGWLSDLPFVSPLVVTIIASALSGVVPIILPFLNGYYSTLISCGIFGFIISALPTVTTALVVDLVGRDSLSSAFGALTFVRGGAALIGPPISGVLYDLTNSYVNTFAFSSGMLILSALIHGIAYFIQVKERRRVTGYAEI